MGQIRIAGHPLIWHKVLLAPCLDIRICQLFPFSGLILSSLYRAWGIHSPPPFPTIQMTSAQTLMKNKIIIELSPILPIVCKIKAVEIGSHLSPTLIFHYSLIMPCVLALLTFLLLKCVRKQDWDDFYFLLLYIESSSFRSHI